MKHFLKKKIYVGMSIECFLLGSSSYILLKTFVLPQEIASVEIDIQRDFQLDDRHKKARVTQVLLNQ